MTLTYITNYHFRILAEMVFSCIKIELLEKL